MEERRTIVEAVRHTRSGKPVDNTFIETFNGRLRDECLSQHRFFSLTDARRTIAQWRVGYNTARPHRALAGQTPTQFAKSFVNLVNFTRLVSLRSDLNSGYPPVRGESRTQ